MWAAVSVTPDQHKTEQMDADQNLPGCHSQQRIDHGEVHSITLELLNERRLVKGDTSRDRLADDALAFGQQLRSQPAETTFFVSHYDFLS